MDPLKAPTSSLYRIGKSLQKRLEKLGIKTIEDLLYYFPFRHEDFSNIKKIKDITPGEIVTIKGKIQLIQNKKSPIKRKNITEAYISDGTGSIKLVWFNQPFLIKTLKVGDFIAISGKVEWDPLGLKITSPIYEKLERNFSTIHTGRLVPVYSLTSNLTQKQIRSLLKIAIDQYINYIKEFLPLEILKKNKLFSLKKAIKEIHFPSSKKDLEKAIFRLKFDELFLLQLKVLYLKEKIKSLKAPKIKINLEEIRKFVNSLPFKLTNAQRKAAWEILKDTQKERPMNRLLEGDVGSGKTIVSMICSLNAVKSGFQTALMVPTEFLARQHFENFCNFFKDFNIKIGILTRSESRTNILGKISKNKIKKLLENGEIEIIIGTHSLIQEDVNFKNLGLVIIDEQHKFGVLQRKLLKEKMFEKEGRVPHFLSMTATPIPRSLALTIYGDLDLSILNEMPKGRKKILTKIVKPNERESFYEFIRKKIKEGNQMFVICPLIEESDKLGVKAATKEYERLKKEVFPEFRIGLLHSKLKVKEKREIQEKFSKGEIDILVSTSVVEVGVDVPNANLMIIEGAERFGLAQLHQFRGRIGRSEKQAYCFLFIENYSEKAFKRISALLTSKSGFELAEKDMKIRGYGDLYGIKQSGFPEFKIASFYDYDIIKLARKEAKSILIQDPKLEKFPNLKEKIEELTQIVHLE